MTRRTRVEESENVRFKYHFHEVSRSIKLAASAASGGADKKQRTGRLTTTNPVHSRSNSPWNPQEGNLLKIEDLIQLLV
jgi:hypothetical protein